MKCTSQLRHKIFIHCFTQTILLLIFPTWYCPCHFGELLAWLISKSSKSMRFSNLPMVWLDSVKLTTQNCRHPYKWSSLGHIRKILVSRPLKIEKVMRACDFYFHFLSFPQGQIEIFETGIILQFLHIMRNVSLFK